MARWNVDKFPPCTIDYSLDITPAEMPRVAEQINILLKAGYLVGACADLEGTMQALFDIAEEVARVDACACVAGEPEGVRFEMIASRGSAPRNADEVLRFLPAALARKFDKAVLLDSARNPQFAEICRHWEVGAIVAFPLRRDREFMGALVFGKRGAGSLDPLAAKLLWVIAMQAESQMLRYEAVRALSFYSFLDPLTHLHNRRYFDEQLDEEIVRSRRNGKPFSLLMLDLDGFKSYNDRFLHAAGDIALQELGGILRDSLREVDTVARLGGDEFALILVESGPDGARDLAARILDRFSRHLLPGQEGARTERLSASVGIASFPADSFDREDLLAKADRALYAAKSLGTGKICLFHELGDLLALKGSPRDLPVSRIYEAARSVVDMDKFLDILLFTAMQGLSAGRGSIVVANEDGTFALRAAVGFENGEARQYPPGTPISPGLVTSWVLENKRPLIVGRAKEWPVAHPPKKNGYRSDSFVSIPLSHEGRVIGTINLTNRRDRRPFTEEDVAAFRPLAERIAAILAEGLRFRENTRRFSTTILGALAGALELRYPFLSGHSERVRLLALRASSKLALEDSEKEALDVAGLLHDVGLVGVPGSILSKKYRLNERELDIARKHPLLGARLLEGVPGMEAARRAILEHHECFDGSGYPYGLRGEKICLPARILAVAEFFDSITSVRPHRGALLREEALQMIGNSGGTLFDPAVARLFVEDPSVTAP